MRNSKKKWLLFVFTLLFTVFLYGQNAWAVSIIPKNLAIDFRSADWDVPEGTSAFSPADSNVTATAIVLDEEPSLSWDDNDGLGIKPGEPDEINSGQSLRIEILGGMLLTGVWITDLFDFPDGPQYVDNYGRSNGLGESGQVIINDGDSIPFYSFFGYESNQLNGELFVSFDGEVEVKTALFSTYTLFDNDLDNEFSVAGFTAAPIPEPATIILLSIGLIGLCTYGRRKGLFQK